MGYLCSSKKFQSNLAKGMVKSSDSSALGSKLQPCGCSEVWQGGGCLPSPPPPANSCCHLPPPSRHLGLLLCLQPPARFCSCSATVPLATILTGAVWCLGRPFLNRLIPVLAEGRGREEYIVSSDPALQRASCSGSASQKQN